MKVIVHIGPPKTATSSLQLALEAVADSRVCYGGAFHPRHRDVDSLNYRIIEACSAEQEPDAAFAAIRTEIRDLSSRHAVLILSEEQFLVDWKPSSRTRLSRLRQLMAGVDCRILVTLRRAGEALPSLYQQMFQQVHSADVPDFSAFCSHSLASCFDYLKVCRLLADVGFADVRLLPFADLVSGGLTLGDVTGCQELGDIALALPHENKSRTGTSGTERLIPGLTLKTALGRSAAALELIRLSGLRRWKHYEALAAQLDRLVWRPGRLEQLTVPPAVLQALDASYDQALLEFDQR
ncbi:hypothetical protein DK847_11020 [Aestuariivirga litoralis]|uniref:Sulfotransferase family protein n=1 Tax=Aestuariivirga litoralis TaxID=2650924 RepID=A0A2W2ANA3_9HYPH|nr:hypothetical protein [Aestuariivirga litoralis]PZF76975.1 hypothetical protein DK847_11020 [Aestuariivirga litoralis]